MRILLIDDSLAYHYEFSILLEKSGVTYTALDFASDAEEGRRLLLAGIHDIYFVDFRLPPSNGLDLVKLARKAGVAKPMIMLTGFGNPAVDIEAERIGASDFLVKGEFTPDGLGRSIRYGLRNAAALEATREAEIRGQLAQQAAGFGVWDWNIRTNQVLWSPEQYELHGLDKAVTGDVLYQTWQDAILPEDRKRSQAAVMVALAGDVSYDVIYRVTRASQVNPEGPPDIRWIRGKGEVFRDACGAPVRMLGINVDVTEQQRTVELLESRRKRAVEDLAFSESRFQAYFEHSTDAQFHMCRRDSGSFEYVAVNPAGLAAFGVSAAQILGRTPVDAHGSERGATVLQALAEVVRTGLPFQHTETFAGPTGGMEVWDAVYMPLANSAGVVRDVIGAMARHDRALPA